MESTPEHSATLERGDERGVVAVEGADVVYLAVHRQGDQLSGHGGRGVPELCEQRVLLLGLELPGGDPTDDAYLTALRGERFSLFDEAAPTELDAPACIVTGRRDRIAGYRDALEGLPHLPNADYTVLADAGHYLPIEAPDVFGDLLNRWLRRTRERQTGESA